MISEKMKALVAGSSAIRAMFEEGKLMAAKYGAENICDFSLGNPNLNPPARVGEAIREVLDEYEETAIHGYMNNAGYEHVREDIAQSINARFGTNFTQKNIIMSVGAAGGLNVALKSLINPGDEVIAFAPFFGEYRSYVANFDGKLVIIPPNPPTFQPNLDEFEKAITSKTKAVIVNTPNNPTGVVYTEENIKKLAAIMEKKQVEYGTDIFLISDEPYRELVYDAQTEVPYLTKYYANTIVGYSYSKSLSLPGERIGYIVIPNEVADFEDMVSAANTATRIMGFVNAPSLMQLAVAKCLDEKADIDFYKRNRDMLYNGLTEAGYECVYPDGAFYLWMKAPIEEQEFVKLAKDNQVITVGGSSFGGPGYIRMAYCVSPKTIETALPRFKKIMEEIKG